MSTPESSQAEHQQLLLKLVVPGELCSCIDSDAIAHATAAIIRYEATREQCWSLTCIAHGGVASSCLLHLLHLWVVWCCAG